MREEGFCTPKGGGAEGGRERSGIKLVQELLSYSRQAESRQSVRLSGTLQAQGARMPDRVPRTGDKVCGTGRFVRKAAVAGV